MSELLSEQLREKANRPRPFGLPGSWQELMDQAAEHIDQLEAALWKYCPRDFQFITGRDSL